VQQQKRISSNHVVLTMQRTELRAILREAQQKYQKSHDEAENLAHEYRNMNVG
jgi:hypothetical protein